jgi:hypothetical protein
MKLPCVIDIQLFPFFAHKLAVLCSQNGSSLLTKWPFFAHKMALLCSQNGPSLLTKWPFYAHKMAFVIISVRM